MSDPATAADVTADDNTPTTTRPSLPLVFADKRRGMPPRHLADLDREGLREAVKKLGLPAPFRT